jgi:hypothetical protein
MGTEPEGNAGRRAKRRGLLPESDTPFSRQAAEVHGPLAVRAYRWGVYGLVPGVGLLLGPAAFLLGVCAWLRGRGDPERKGLPLSKAATVLGFLIGVTQWAGLTLMVLALRGD